MRCLGFKDNCKNVNDLDIKEEVLEEVKVEDVLLDVKEEVLEEVKAEVKEEEVLNTEVEYSFAKLEDADVFRQTFYSEADAHAFYNAYARVTGFSIRKDRIKRNEHDVVLSRKWVCSRQGLRDSQHFMRKDRRRRPWAETRVGCAAVFRVRLERSLGKYVVTHFVSKHNHELVDPQCVPFLWSHRALSSADKAEISTMRDVGMKPIDMMDLMSKKSGGLHKVGFIDKDLHNYIQSQRIAGMEDGDTESALGYMHSKAIADPHFFFKYSVDSENRLDRLFWADSRSRLDYVAFGDVLAFDSTYRTNVYNKPLVILTGVSNHFKTTVFGCALLGDETAKTYTWVLESLMEAMDGKKPVSVLTDGDKAMQQAIRNVFPGCSHRLCMWHLMRNAASNVHKPKFQDDFKRVAFKDCEIREFEKEWAEVVKKYGIEKHSWVLETYRKRHMWADSYLRGKFFAGMRSTQRCESMNAYFNRFLTRGMRLYEFVSHFDRGVNRLRFKDVEAKAVTDNSFPVMETTLKSLERHGAEVFSRAIFVKFREEIVAESCLFLLGKHDTEDHCMYEVGKYGARNSIWTVDYKPCNDIMKCSCLKMDSVGFPCRHMISVMKREHLRQIPPGCVLPRWMRRTMEHGHQGQFVCKDSTTITQTARYGTLSSTFNLVSYYASHLDMEFDEARKVALEMMCRFRKKLETEESVYHMADKGNDEGGDEGRDGEGHVDLFGVGDPAIVRTKGNPGGPCPGATPRKPRRCSHCRSIGHTKRTCKKLHSRGVKDECTKEEIVNQSQMRRSRYGGSASTACRRRIRHSKIEDVEDHQLEEGSQTEEEAVMGDEDSDDDTYNHEEEEGEEDDTDTRHPSKNARMWR